MSMIETTPLRLGGSELVRIAPPEPATELEEFIYIVSHDLRNSARALGEIPQWLREDLSEQGVSLNAESLEDFALLERHARRLDRMLVDLLAYSRVGRLQENTRVSVSHFIQRVVSDRIVPDRVHIHYPPNLPEVTIGYKDGYILVQSIIDNVVRHCGEDDVHLYINAQRDGAIVTLDFQDTGPGVALRDLDRMFRPMITLQRRDVVEGSGMGLAIVQRIARHYNGDIFAGVGQENGGLHLRVTLDDFDLRPTERIDDLGFGNEAPNDGGADS